MKDIVPVAGKMLAWNLTAARADGGKDWAWLYYGAPLVPKTEGENLNTKLLRARLAYQRTKEACFSNC